MMMEDNRLQHFYRRADDESPECIEKESIRSNKAFARWMENQRTIMMKKLCNTTSTRDMDLYHKGQIAFAETIISVWIKTTGEETDEQG